jgi:hypothetical protein
VLARNTRAGKKSVLHDLSPLEVASDIIPLGLVDGDAQFERVRRVIKSDTVSASEFGEELAVCPVVEVGV